MQPIHIALAIAGAFVGGLVGIATRPSVMGVKIPVGVLTSSSPMDAPFKSDFISHLLLTTGIGLVVGVVLAFAVAAVLKSNTPA